MCPLEGHTYLSKPAYVCPFSGYQALKLQALIPQNGQALSKNCLSVFDHFVWLVLKGLKGKTIINGNNILVIQLTKFAFVLDILQLLHLP